jgi:hypothetical protein
VTTNWPETLLKVAVASGSGDWPRATTEKSSAADKTTGKPLDR